MYPATYFGLFPAFPRDERGFVAMSFDKRFDARWTNVIAPAISSVCLNDIALEPHRVDLRTASDSILTEILDGIARCRIFLADISIIGEIGGKAVRNANVMYEVGIAHAARQPEEVILLRSDDRELGFDIANVRVHYYDPDGSSEFARQFVVDKIAESLREVDLKKGLAVRRAAESLDYRSWMMLVEAHSQKPVCHPSNRNVREALAAIPRANAISKLLEIGALRPEFGPPTPELLDDEQTPAEQLVPYRVTPFGQAVFDHVVEKMGLLDPNIQSMLRATGLDDFERNDPA